MDLPFEQFPAPSAVGICRHVFTQRIAGIDVSHDKAKVLKLLGAAHREIQNAIGIGDWPLFTSQQVHGNKIAILLHAARADVNMRKFITYLNLCGLRTPFRPRALHVESVNRERFS